MKRPARSVTGTLSLAVCLLCAAAELSAQTSTTSSLRGRILDEGGGGVPGVTVTLSNPSAAVGSMSHQTDVEGNFAFKLLPPSSGYMLKASIPGFATVVAGPFDLDPGRITVQNLTLKPSSELEETITVEAHGHIVDTSSTKTSTVYNSEFIEGLPLLGRQFQDVLTLAPGVTDTDGDGHPNVRGARDTGLQLRLDGSNITDPLTGHFGQEINLETIEEVEVITSGAPAEYGRADGGFANVITKSGGNDFEASLKIFFRSDFLDGNGVQNNDQDNSTPPPTAFTDTRAFLTAGGAIVKDHAWYFGSVERLDREEPVSFSTGGGALKTEEGWRAFGKLTWQANPGNKLALQLNYDPVEFGGNFIESNVPPDSDFLLRSGGPVLQLKWTSIVSPTLLVETLLSRMDVGVAILPVSDEFREIEIRQARINANQIAVELPCRTINCRGDPSIFTFQENFRRTIRGLVSTDTDVLGPYFFRSDDQRERTTLKADLSYTIEEALGSHALKTGFEFNDERYYDEPITNPQLTDRTTTCQGAGRTNCNVSPTTRFGELDLEISDPVRQELTAEGLNAGAYLQNAWKPRPHLTVNLGVRYDHESIDSRGFLPFEPVAESREMLRRFDILCDAFGSACTTARDPGRTTRGLPGFISLANAAPTHPAHNFDLDGDGDVDLSSSSPEFVYYSSPITTTAERSSEGFAIRNGNLSPRLSLSWDPWADGRTKVFGTWNKYYDRIFLGVAAQEQDPDTYLAVWGDFASLAELNVRPEELSSPISVGIKSINQVDRDLRTPHTIEWSVGIERELAPEWAVTLTYISRRGIDLLQDIDVNHIYCGQFDTAFGVDPFAVCGDGGHLELDRFGGTPVYSDPNLPGSVIGISPPNGAPDLYVLNPKFNRVLRVGNFNSSEYHSTELILRKRLHRNWQMQFSYTVSEARGDAEQFEDLAGNDPAVSDTVAGFLDFDQRHVLKWQGVTHLPNDLLLGATVQWASGLPYSHVTTVVDFDDAGNGSGTRNFFPSGLKNDHRNEGQWTLNARLEKRFKMGPFYGSSFLSAENLLNSDDLTIHAVRAGSRGDGLDETRRFGRRFEIGLALQR